MINEGICHPKISRKKTDFNVYTLYSVFFVIKNFRMSGKNRKQKRDKITKVREGGVIWNTLLFGPKSHIKITFSENFKDWNCFTIHENGAEKVSDSQWTQV